MFKSIEVSRFEHSSQPFSPGADEVLEPEENPLTVTEPSQRRSARPSIEGQAVEICPVPRSEFEHRSSQQITDLFEKAPRHPHGIRSMALQDPSITPRMWTPSEQAQVIDIYRRLYERPFCIDDTSLPRLQSAYLCYAEVSPEGTTGQRPFVRLCLGENRLDCQPSRNLYLNLTDICFPFDHVAAALRILIPYDDQITAVAELIGRQNPELKASNIRLFLYSSLLMEIAFLRPHDIWQDVSACGWVSDSPFSDECGFADKIDAVIEDPVYTLYDSLRTDELERAYQRAWSSCSLFSGWRFSVDDCASRKGIRQFVYNSRPTWRHRLAWRLASRRPETHRTRQGFGAGQIILGYAMAAARDPEVFTPFVRKGLLTRDQFDSEEDALNTIISPETFIYAKGLAFHFALIHLKRTLFSNPSVAFPSDAGFFIPNDQTARELALLATAESEARFPDEDNPGHLSAEKIRQENLDMLLTNDQHTLFRLFMVASLLGEVPDTPGLSMIAEEANNLRRQGVGMTLTADLMGAFGISSGNDLFFHWVPPWESSSKDSTIP